MVFPAVYEQYEYYIAEQNRPAWVRLQRPIGKDCTVVDLIESKAEKRPVPP